MFLSLMLWFVLDSAKTVMVVANGERKYAVQNVIKADSSGINFDCVEDEELD